MIENNAKKWYGSYSRAGRTSAENFYAIIHKDEILKRDKRKIKNIYENQRSKLDYLDGKINLKKIINTKYSVINNISVPKKKKIISYKKDNSKYKYHNLHYENLITNNEIYLEPSCTKYNPKYDFIYKKLITGPHWKDLLGRNYPIQNMENTTFFLNNTQRINKVKKTSKKDNNNNNKNSYSSSKKNKKKQKKYNIIDSGVSKCLVDMDTTTQRGEIMDATNLRIRTDKPFNKNDINKIKSPLIINLFSKFNKNNKKETKYLNNKEKNNNLKNPNIKTNNKNSKKIRKSLINLSINNNSDSSLYSPLLRRLSTITPEIYNVPEITKTMPFEQKESINQFKKKLMPKVSLNYSLIRERPLSMVIYKKSDIKQKKEKFLGIDPSLNFDIDKIINKYNNHVVHEAPNFNYMTSRPYDKNDPLPNFMKQVFNRMSVGKVNDKSLKLNGYSDGKFLSTSNSFFPKSSFNSIINMSLLRDNDLKNKNMEEYKEIETEKLINRLGFKKENYINYKNLILDGALNKFDKITFKTVNTKNKIKINGPLLKKLILFGHDNLKNDNKFLNVEDFCDMNQNK